MSFKTNNIIQKFFKPRLILVWENMSLWQMFKFLVGPFFLHLIGRFYLIIYFDLFLRDTFLQWRWWKSVSVCAGPCSAAASRRATRTVWRSRGSTAEPCARSWSTPTPAESSSHTQTSRASSRLPVSFR